MQGTLELDIQRPVTEHTDALACGLGLRIGINLHGKQERGGTSRLRTIPRSHDHNPRLPNNTTAL
uniref:Transposase n=1 Tax=Heterorhabditis bacteriophora TaxID=37862 RepID=A0A1I7WZD1_HETBA